MYGTTLLYCIMLNGVRESVRGCARHGIGLSSMALSPIILISLLIGGMEGYARRCGILLGIILGLFPVVGWIMLSSIPYKGNEW